MGAAVLYYKPGAVLTTKLSLCLQVAVGPCCSEQQVQNSHFHKTKVFGLVRFTLYLTYTTKCKLIFLLSHTTFLHAPKSHFVIT